MTDTDKVVAAALELKNDSVESLEMLLARRDVAIKANQALRDDLTLDPAYTEEVMAGVDLKALGKKIVHHWNQSLYGLCCNAGASESKERKDLIAALHLGEAAVIATVVTALLGLGVAAAIAAALAPILVKQFIMPAGKDLCEAWGQAIKDS